MLQMGQSPVQQCMNSTEIKVSFGKPTFFTQFDLMVVEHTSDIRRLKYSL